MTEGKCTDPKVKLEAINDMIVFGREITPGETFYANRHDAADLLLGGTCKLALTQEVAPTTVVADVTARFVDLDKLGKVWLRPEAIEQFETYVLPGGSRRNALAGKELRWLEGKGELFQFITDRYSFDAELYELLQEQFRACLEFKSKGPKSLFSSSKRIPENEAISRGLVLYQRPPRRIAYLSGSSGGSDYVYKHLGEDWAAFQRELSTFERLLVDAALAALAEGRLLAVVKENGISNLQAISRWKELTCFPSRARHYSFLSTHDLPDSWLPRRRSLRGPERVRMVGKIKEELEQRYLVEAPNQEKLKKKDLLQACVEKHDVSRKLAQEAWDQANLPKWQKPGRRKGSWRT